MLPIPRSRNQTVGIQDGCMAFEEADMVFVLRKLYTYDMQESGFITDDGFPQAFYSEDPYHKAFISEITAVYVKE